MVELGAVRIYFGNSNPGCAAIACRARKELEVVAV